MPEIIFTVRGRIRRPLPSGADRNAPIRDHPANPHQQVRPARFETTRSSTNLYYAFAHRNFSVLRFQFRGVRAQSGLVRPRQGELADAGLGAGLAQSINPEARTAGRGFPSGPGFGAAQ